MSLSRVSGAVVLAAAILVAGLPAAAQAQPAAAGDRSVSVTVRNNTSLRLRLSDSEVSEGVWTRRPTRTISSYRVGSLATESSDSQGGTEGSATYWTSSGTIEINWNNPYLDPSTMTCSAPGDVNCEINGLVTDVWHVTTTVVLTDL